MRKLYDMASGFDDRRALEQLKVAKLRTQLARLPFMDKIQERPLFDEEYDA